MDVRLLIGADGEHDEEVATLAEVSEGRLATWYAVPAPVWLRATMVSTVDGAATGESGRSGSVNTPADRLVFATLRGLAEAVLVGAGTARAEGYGPASVPIVVVSGSGWVPESLRGAPSGAVLLGTRAGAPGVQAARAELGPDRVVVSGEDRVDLAGLLEKLRSRGLGRLLCEGGPRLLGSLLEAGLVDELCATVSPQLVSSDHPRILAGAAVDVPLRLRLLLEHEGTLLARWTVR